MTSEEAECPTCGRDDFKNYIGMKFHYAKTHGESLSGILVECDWCGDEFRKQRCDVDRTGRDYCTQECYGRSKLEHGSKTVECDWCGSEFQKCRSRLERSDRHYCTDECWVAWRSINWMGENNPNWTGGTFPYGKGWNEKKREKVRESQDRECASCGMHESENGKRLDVHHIEKARSIADPEERNAVENLVALCQTCHKRWEQMSPLRPITIGGESA